MRLQWAPGSAMGTTRGHHGLVMTLGGTCETREWKGIRGGGNHRIYMSTARGSYRGSLGVALSMNTV